MKKTVIVKTGHTIPSLLAGGEDFEDWIIATSGFDSEQFATVSVFSGDRLPELDDCAALIVTGSPAYVTDLEPWSEATAGILRSALKRQLPVLGICYGHQLLAHCLGGRVDFHPRGREIGTVPINLSAAGTEDPLLGSLPRVFPAQVSHSQTVLKLPPEAVLLAGNGFEPHHAFRVGTNAWGLQFHPEFSARITRAYIEERRQQLVSEGLDPEGLLEQVGPTPESAHLLGRFMELVKETVQN
ncbi:MAG: glutamine amidotransferase [Gammaproteobacteria bacterium]|nr:glutamine amidotransferase [Pseudomonadales bacterium]MCP5346632.1 glutamine amidotransferase [Pseudomonadales bacterium]